MQTHLYTRRLGDSTTSTNYNSSFGQTSFCLLLPQAIKSAGTACHPILKTATWCSLCDNVDHIHAVVSKYGTSDWLSAPSLPWPYCFCLSTKREREAMCRIRFSLLLRFGISILSQGRCRPRTVWLFHRNPHKRNEPAITLRTPPLLPSWQWPLAMGWEHTNSLWDH